MDKQLAKETIITANEYIQKLITATDTIYNHIQQGRQQEGLDILSQFAEGLEWLYQAVNLTKEAQGDAIDSEEIRSVVLLLEENVKNQDYHSATDILIYEIKPILEKWHINLQAEVKSFN